MTPRQRDVECARGVQVWMG